MDPSIHAAPLAKLVENIYARRQVREHVAPPPPEETFLVDDYTLEESTETLDTKGREARVFLDGVYGLLPFVLLCLITILLGGRLVYEDEIILYYVVTFLLTGFFALLAWGKSGFFGGGNAKPAEPEFEVPVQKPRQRSRTVWVGVRDFPIKRVSVMRPQQVTMTAEVLVDGGPSGYRWFLFVLAALVLLFAVMLFPGATDAVADVISPVLITNALIFACAVAFLYFTRNRRSQVPVEIPFESWELKEETVELRVDPKFAPRKTEEVTDDLAVTGLGVLTIPVSAVRVNDHNLLFEHSGLFEQPEFAALQVKPIDRIRQIHARLQELETDIPAILGGDRADVPVQIDSAYAKGVTLRGEELELHDLFGELAECYKDVELEVVKLPLLRPDHPLTRVLVENSDAVPVSAAPEVLSFMTSIQADAAHPSEIAKDFLRTWPRHSAVLFACRCEALDQDVLPMIRDLGSLSHYGSYNFYCPDCIREITDAMVKRDYSVDSDQENEPIYFSPNSRMHFDLEHNDWVCPVCELRTQHPFPLHKTFDEVFWPTYDRLLEEHKLERLELDNKTRDSELEYRNKFAEEQERIQRAQDAELSRIKTEIELISAEVQGKTKAIEALQGIIGGYTDTQDKHLKEIIDRNLKAQKEITEREEATIRHIGKFTNKLITDYTKEMLEYSKAVRVEERKRDELARRTLDSLEDIKESSRQTAENSGQMVAGIQNIGTKMDAMQENISGLRGDVRSHMALDAAIAKKQGYDVMGDHSIFRIGKTFSSFLAGAQSTLEGDDSWERTQREMEATR